MEMALYSCRAVYCTSSSLVVIYVDYSITPYHGCMARWRVLKQHTSILVALLLPLLLNNIIQIRIDNQQSTIKELQVERAI